MYILVLVWYVSIISAIGVPYGKILKIGRTQTLNPIALSLIVSVSVSAWVKYILELLASSRQLEKCTTVVMGLKVQI